MPCVAVHVVTGNEQIVNAFEQRIVDDPCRFWFGADESTTVALLK
jgi:hypothetical protein